MKRKYQSLRWLILMLMCCTVATTHASATVNIQGGEPIGQYNGYPLFAIESDSITVSSSYGSFNYIWIDDIPVAYIYSSVSYTMDISAYMDKKIHCLELRDGSSSYGTCYFTCILPIDGIYYSVTDNEAVVLGSKTEIATANILSGYEYNGTSYPVTKISKSAFAERSNLTTVTIPNSVKSIGGSAFKNCSALDSLTFNAENCYISVGAFPSSISHLTIGDKVTKIPAYFLYNGNSIENLTIPNSVTSIGEYAFNESVYLKSLTLGAALKSIEDNAFSDKYGNRIRIPKVFWLGNTPPEGASNVRASEDYASNDQYGYCKIYPFLSSKFIVDGTVYVPVSPSERTCDVVDCIYDKNRTNVEISDRVSNRGIEMKVNEICPYSFYENNYIQSLKLSNNGSIGNNAFYNCSKVEALKLSNKGSIGESAFYGCSKVETLALGQGIEKILDRAFARCSSIKEVSIPNSVIQLGSYAFEYCSALKSVSIGTGISILPKYAFGHCTSLTSLSIPNNVQSIENYAFNYCKSLADVSFEGLDEQMISQSFPDWTSTNYASGSTSEQEYTFSVVSGDVLTFNYSVKGYGYDKLIVKINDTVVVSEQGNESSIYRKEFTANGQVSLYMAYIKGISGSDKASVTNIWLNNQRLELGSNGTDPLFADCPLDEVYIGRKLSYKTSSDYGYSPFYRNTSLRTVEITDAETQIYDNEFYGCSNLKSLKIGNGVKSIGNWAFSGCSSLDYFSAGFHVESIGEEAFSDCTGLKKYYSYSMIPPVCSSQALDDINKWDCTLYVPANSSDEYKAANQWKEFFFVDEMDAVLVADIKLNMSEISMSIGETFQLTTEVLPSNATNQSVVWESSNPECVTIDGNGLVSAISDGTSMITVKSADGNCEATCLVSVSPDSGIEDIIVSTADGIYTVYNFQGILVLKTEDIERVKQLPAGLYIVNGKKMIIR